MNEKLKEKTREALTSVLPITVIVLMLSVTLVPMEVEMKQPMTNRPTTARPPGRRVRPRLTVESTPPAAVAAPVKAPARRKMRHMVMMLSSESSSAIRCIFSLNLRPRFWRKATARAMRKTTMAGMA